MPTLTTRIGLKKPLGNEINNRNAYNQNLDIIDEKLALESDLKLVEKKADDAFTLGVSAKNKTVTALTSLGEAVTVDNTWDEIASIITNLSKIKYESGESTRGSASTTIEISGLTFKPDIFIVTYMDGKESGKYFYFNKIDTYYASVLYENKSVSMIFTTNKVTIGNVAWYVGKDVKLKWYSIKI